MRGVNFCLQKLTGLTTRKKIPLVFRMADNWIRMLIAILLQERMDVSGKGRFGVR